jgi:TetR/AcrR family transcriptional regulator, transcriptional repressor of aconitase
MPRVTEQHRETRRAQILDAARRCFVRQGFHETSMQELLAEAGLSSGAVYGYFSSKDELIVAIAEDNISQISALLRSFTDREAPGTARDLLIEVLGFIRSMHAENGFAAIALLVWSEATRKAELAARLTELMTEYRNSFSRLAGPGGQPWNGLSPQATGALLTSVVVGYIARLAIVGDDATEDLSGMIAALIPDVDRSEVPG